MAVLWRRDAGGRRTEVRSAGATRRLYVDGVLHTAWNPRLTVTGAVWDPLGLAPMLLPQGAVREALVLGVGGGAALQMMRLHLRPRRITGVERDPALVGVARRWFGLGGPGVRLVTADAVEWVRRQPRGRKWDVVVGDLFHEDAGEPVRATSGRAWWRRVTGLVAPGGLFVVNFADPATARGAGLLDDPRIAARFPGAVRFSCPGYTNAIFALGPRAIEGASLMPRLRETGSIPPAGRRELRFRVSPVPRGGASR